MAALHREVGMRFIIGLPLMGDNALLLKDMMAVARQHLPEQAIIGFELGNEPTYWQVCPDIYTGAVSDQGHDAADQVDSARIRHMHLSSPPL